MRATHERLVTAYEGRFSDEAAPGWAAVRRTDGRWDLALPNKQSLVLDARRVDDFWNESPAQDPRTTILWRNSLKALLEIHAAEGDWSTALPALKGFARYLRAQGPTYDTLRSGSLDHQMALALRSAATFRSRLNKSTGVTPKLYDEVLAALMDVVSEAATVIKEGTEFRADNHGVMLTIACEHAAVIFPEVSSITSLAESGRESLIPSLRVILDDQGVVRENTPLYQKLYVSLMRQLADFQEWADVRSDATLELRRLTALAEEALHLMLLPNGHIPPLGDAVGGGSGYGPHPGELYSPGSGLYIWKDEETFVSAVCGFRGVIHKQADDTSVTLWHAGEHLIRDAGLLSYDENDEVAVTLRSQRGHSGFFLERFDSSSARDLISFGANTSRVTGSLERVTNGDSEIITMRKLHDGGSPLRRTLELYRQENGMLITDTFEGVPTSSDARVSRFLFDPSLALTLTGDTLEMRSRTSFVTVAVSGDVTLRFYRGHRSDDAHSLIGNAALARGLVATAPYKVSSTWAVEYLHTSSEPDAAVTFDVRYGRI